MNVGKRIKELRKKKDMTLQELSQKSGVALATLSRMENGKMPGTARSHMNICKALGFSLAELYYEMEDGSKTVESVAGEDRSEHFSNAQKAKLELLVSKTSGKKMLPIAVRIGPGGYTKSERNKHGSEKFIYMMKGALEVDLGKNKYHLKSGDSLYFDATLPHRFRNLSKTEAEAVCVTAFS